MWSNPRRACLVLLACAVPIAACNELISVGQNNAPGDGGSFDARVSADGRFVAFDSTASNLVASDTNGGLDVFVRDRSRGSTERVSVRSDGSEAACCSATPQISDDGRFVVFSSSSPDLVPAGTFGVLVRDRLLGTTRFLGEGRRPAISADGRWVAFVRDEVLVTPPGLSRPVPTGTPVLLDLLTGEIDTSLSRLVRTAADLSFSADGRFLAFSLYLLNVDFIPGQTISAAQVAGASIQVFDRTLQALDVAGPGARGARPGILSQRPSLSADGRIVAFDSTDASLVPGDTNRVFDVFASDRTTGVIERISVNEAGEQGNGGSAFASISADGDRVVFASFASNLDSGDSNGLLDSFVRVRSRNLTRRISIADDGTPANGACEGADISSDGRISVYSSNATNLSGVVDMGTTFDIFEKPVDEVLPPLLSFTANGERVSDGPTPFSPPVAPPPFRSGQPLQLDAVTLDSDRLGFPVFAFAGISTPISFLWNFGGGQVANPLEIFAQRPIVTFQLPPGVESSTFTVTVTAFARTSLSTTATGSIVIHRSGPPVVNLVVDGLTLPATDLPAAVSILKPDGVVRFGSLAFDESGLGFPIFSGFGNSTPISHLWSFGGGVPANALDIFSPSPTVAFPVGIGQPTEFRVSLTVFDATGQSSTRAVNILVRDPVGSPSSGTTP